jgi:hypothetical protein
MSAYKNDRASVLKKIKALFDLAEKSHSKHEMATALERARGLLQKYGLTMGDVDEISVEQTYGASGGWVVFVPKSAKSIWKNHLAAIVAEYFECKVARQGDSFVFYGPDLIAQSTAYGFESLHNQIIDLATLMQPSVRDYFTKGALGAHTIKSYAAYCREAKHEYRTGLAIGLEAHLQRLKEEEQAYAEGHVKRAGSIVRVVGDIADKWAEHKGIVLCPDEEKKEQRHKVTGTENCTQGVEDSKRLRLLKGLTGSK